MKQHFILSPAALENPFQNEILSFSDPSQAQECFHLGTVKSLPNRVLCLQYFIHLKLLSSLHLGLLWSWELKVDEESIVSFFSPFSSHQLLFPQALEEGLGANGPHLTNTVVIWHGICTLEILLFRDPWLQWSFTRSLHPPGGSVGWHPSCHLWVACSIPWFIHSERAAPCHVSPLSSSCCQAGLSSQPFTFRILLEKTTHQSLCPSNSRIFKWFL